MSIKKISHLIFIFFSNCCCDNTGIYDNEERLTNMRHVQHHVFFRSKIFSFSKKQSYFLPMSRGSWCLTFLEISKKTCLFTCKTLCTANILCTVLTIRLRIYNIKYESFLQKIRPKGSQFSPNFKTPSVEFALSTKVKRR